MPVLFLTARVLEEDQLRGYELGADDYILKPFSLRVLLAKCQAVLERYQCGMQAEQQKGLWKHEKRQQFFCDGQPVELQSLDLGCIWTSYDQETKELKQEWISLKACIEKSESSENGGMNSFQTFYQKQDGQVRLKKLKGYYNGNVFNKS